MSMFVWGEREREGRAERVGEGGRREGEREVGEAGDRGMEGMGREGGKGVRGDIGAKKGVEMYMMYIGLYIKRKDSSVTDLLCFKV